MNKDGNALVYLAGEAGEVTVELAVPKIAAVVKPLAPIQASQWKAQAQLLVRFSESRLVYSSRVFARATDGSGVEMNLDLPANASAVAVSGEDVADWSQSPGADGRRQLSVRWKTRDVLDRELAIGYVTPQSPLADQWALQAPTVPGDKEARHLYAILPADGLELTAEGLRAAVESRRLPDWMRQEIGGAPFVTAEAGAGFVVGTHWLPVIATAEALVSAVKAELRLVADGATQTTITYTIKHESPLAWQLELPDKVELLSCTVGGRPAHPIQRAKGGIELAIPQGDDATHRLTTVSLVYTAKSSALDPVSGKVTLELPRTPLFIEHLDWSISIPVGFEVSDVDGNLSMKKLAATGPADAAAGSRDPGAVVLFKDFCRAERPSVALFYQRRGLDN